MWEKLCYAISLFLISGVTIGVDLFVSFIAKNDILYCVQFWDTASNLPNHSIRPTFLKMVCRDADLIIVVLSVVDPSFYYNIEQNASIAKCMS